MTQSRVFGGETTTPSDRCAVSLSISSSTTDSLGWLSLDGLATYNARVMIVSRGSYGAYRRGFRDGMSIAAQAANSSQYLDRFFDQIALASRCDADTCQVAIQVCA